MKSSLVHINISKDNLLHIQIIWTDIFAKIENNITGQKQFYWLQYKSQFCINLSLNTKKYILVSYIFVLFCMTIICLYVYIYFIIICTHISFCNNLVIFFLRNCKKCLFISFYYKYYNFFLLLWFSDCQ
jgi:hypothetical protein